MSGDDTSTEDRELMARIAQSRDREAFAVLFRRFAPRLRAHLRRGALTHGQSDELVQEVMLHAWHRAEQYDASRAAVSTWLFTIARNRFIDGVRKQRRALPEGYVDMDTPEASPDEALATERRAHEVACALESLPPEQREAIVEVFFVHRTHAEAAEELAVPLGTQKSRVRAGLMTLRRSLQGKWP